MAQPETISSAANPLVKDIRRAIARGGLTSHGCWIAETFHLLEEALAARREVEAVLAAESVASSVEGRLPPFARRKLTVLPDRLFQSLSATETAQGVMALVKPPAWQLEQLFGDRALIAILDGLQDPGNAGTVVRTAEAFGATGALFLKGTVSPYNPKTLRASAGSLFRLPFVAGADPALARSTLAQRAIQLFAGVPSRAATASEPIHTAGLTHSCALLIGSEAHGVSAEWLSAARPISIPTQAVESLNAAVAAGILLYEAHRQRSETAR